MHAAGIFTDFGMDRLEEKGNPAAVSGNFCRRRVSGRVVIRDPAMERNDGWFAGWRDFTAGSSGIPREYRDRRRPGVLRVGHISGFWQNLLLLFLSAVLCRRMRRGFAAAAKVYQKGGKYLFCHSSWPEMYDAGAVRVKGGVCTCEKAVPAAGIVHGRSCLSDADDHFPAGFVLYVSMDWYESVEQTAGSTEVIQQLDTRAYFLDIGNGKRSGICCLRRFPADRITSGKQSSAA